MKTKTTTANLILALVIILALGSVVSLTYERLSWGNPKTSLRPAEWRDLTRTNLLLGADDKQTEIVIFADFECPFCRDFALRTWPELYRHRGDLSLRFRNFPLPQHEHAFAAAVAAVCANKQGRFAAFHDAVFEAQDSLSVASFERLAEKAGVPDQSSFTECLRSNDAAEQVRRDLSLGNRIGVRGTPTIIVNGTILGGSTGIREPLAVLSQDPAA